VEGNDQPTGEAYVYALKDEDAYLQRDEDEKPADMTAASVERSELDPRSLMLVRLAALAAVDAPPVSYLMNLAVASDVGVVPRMSSRS
jgi:hypothetical protein